MQHQLAMIGAGLIWRQARHAIGRMGKLQGSVGLLGSEVRAHASLSRRAIVIVTARESLPQDYILCAPLTTTLTISRHCDWSAPQPYHAPCNFLNTNHKNGRLKTRIWSHAHLTFSRASASPPASPRAPRRFANPILLLHKSQLTPTAEGKAPLNLPMPLLQPREVRLRLHREEIRRRQPAVQSLRPDLPDKHQLPLCARRRLR